MPLYDELETRPRYGSALPSYEPESVRLDPTDEMDLRALAIEAAKAGALGAPVAAGGLGAVRGAGAGAAQRLADIEYWDKGPDMGMRRFREPTVEQLAEQARDIEFYKQELADYGGKRSLSDAQLDDIDDLRRAINNPFYQTREEVLAPYLKRIEVEKAALRHGRATGWDRSAMTDHLMKGPSAWLGREYHQGVPIEEVRTIAEKYDRMIPPSRMSRAGSILKSGIKGALSPVSIAADALLGGAVGAASAVGGYASEAPRSAGLFTPPGEGYEGVASPELIQRIAEQKELENEAERQRLLEQYRASGYDLDPLRRLTRLRDLR